MPTAFWASVLPGVRARHPDAYILGEVLHGDYAEFVSDSGVDAVTQYELWKAIWSSINDANFFELAWALDRHNRYLDTFAPLTFVGNHDVTRIATRIDDDRQLGHALAVLLTVGGTPSIYYGDEQAFRGLKEDRAGGDDEIRPAFPADPSELSPAGGAVFRLHQDVIGLRRRNPWLHRAKTRPLSLTNAAFAFELRADADADSESGPDGRAGADADAGAGGHRLIVALNVGDADAEFDLEGDARVLAGRARIGSADDQRTAVTVDGHDWAILA